MIKLDPLDKKILEILSNEDINLNELSERVNLSVSSVHRRIKNLLDAEVITPLHHQINYQKLGFSLHILLQVSLSRHDSDTFSQFLDEVREIPEIINAFLITGQSADFLLEVLAKDMDNYSEVLLKRLGKIEYVSALHSSFVIKEYNVMQCDELLKNI